jgi:hypothetical protein
VRTALTKGRRTAYGIAREVYGDHFSAEMAAWQMGMVSAWLTHLEATGEVVRTPAEGDDPAEHWSRAS